MKRLMLQRLNGALLVLVALWASAIQSSLFGLWPISLLKPDVLLWAVVWCALRRPFIEGGILALVLSQVEELHSSEPSGLAFVTNMAVFLGTHFANRVLVIPTLRSYATVTAIGFVAKKIFALTLLSLLGAYAGSTLGAWKETVFWIVPRAAWEAFLGFWVFQGLEWFDLATFKSERSEVGLEEFEVV